MSSKYALSVSLTERLCAFVKQEVASGRYSTASEVVRTALRQLEAEADRPFSTSRHKTERDNSALPPGPVTVHARARRSAS